MKVPMKHRIAILAATAVPVVACARVRADESASASSASVRGAETRADPPPAPERGTGMMGGQGPAQAANTTVTSTDVDGGAALVFTTRTGDVAELRQRARDMAEMHNQRLAARETRPGARGPGGRQHHGGGGGPGHAGGGMMGGGMMMSMPAATASVEDVENGARVVFRPEDPAQLESLREAVRTRAERMASGACPMMSLDEPQGDKGQETKPPSSGPK